jgi:hypothetical protein
LEKNPELTGEVLVTLHGEPIITTDSLVMEKAKLFKNNPQYLEVLHHIGLKEFERNLLEGLISQAVADEYISVTNINQTVQYKIELKEAYKSVEQMLNAKFFSESVPAVKFRDAEVLAYYDENKEKMGDDLSSDYDQIKDRLKGELEQNKHVELIEKKIDVLKKEYEVVVNEDYFKD